MRSSFIFVWVLLVAACGARGLLQGDEYEPDGTLPAALPRDRPEAGPPDASADARPLPGSDAATLPTNTCESARAFGSVSGDTGSTTATTTGSCAEWVSVRVTEDDGNALGAAMKAKLTLTPRGSDFDLYVFFEPNADEVACTFPYASGTTSGSTAEAVFLAWGEGTVANGKEDGRTLRAAVVKPGGACVPDAGWTLLVEGNR
jgi:hypothetical protein